MVGDLPPAPGEGPTIGPPPGPAQWAPAFPIQPPTRPRTWPAIALAALGVLLGVAALVVALARPSTDKPVPTSTASPTSSFTTDQTAAAHQKLCDAYRLAARAVQIETNGNSAERAGIATVNGAVLIQQALSAAPALPGADRAAAVALAEAYSNAAAVASLGDTAAWQSTIADVNAKDAAMKKVCGIG
nr:hypothetical protein [Mycobacterium sp. 1245499.0]